MKNFDCKIISNTKLNEGVFELKLDMPSEFNILSGQFVNIYLESKLLGRPFSFVDFSNNVLTLVYKVVGCGTKELTTYENGRLIKVLGPLGTGFDTSIENKKVVLVGAGVGLPPILNLYNELKAKNDVKLVAAFTNESDVFYEDEVLSSANNDLLVQNSDKYSNLNPIQFLDNTDFEFDHVVACGPSIVLMLLDKRYQDSKTGQISIEERMGCGHGNCYGCSQKTKEDTNVLTCIDGPVFNLGVLS